MERNRFMPNNLRRTLTTGAAAGVLAVGGFFVGEALATAPVHQEQVACIDSQSVYNEDVIKYGVSDVPPLCEGVILHEAPVPLG